MLVAALHMQPASAVEASVALIDQATKSGRLQLGELRAAANVLS
jgi:hypothetical protein